MDYGNINRNLCLSKFGRMEMISVYEKSVIGKVNTETFFDCPGLGSIEAGKAYVENFAFKTLRRHPVLLLGLPGGVFFNLLI